MKSVQPFMAAILSKPACKRDQKKEAEGIRKIAHQISTVTIEVASRPRESHRPRWRDWSLVEERGGPSFPRDGKVSVNTAGRAHQIRRKKPSTMRASVKVSPGPTLNTREAAK